MGFIYKGIVNKKLHFIVKGEDIAYAMQFEECQWNINIDIFLKLYDYNFVYNDEYFLCIDKGVIQCIWEYCNYVPNFVRKVDEKKLLKNIKNYKKTKQDLIKKIDEYKQPTFPLEIYCGHGTKNCKSEWYPYWNLIFSEERFENLLPLEPYFCEYCLENPIPAEKKEITSFDLMEFLYW